jgi:hypothetical protein
MLKLAGAEAWHALLNQEKRISPAFIRGAGACTGVHEEDITSHSLRLHIPALMRECT